MNQFKPNYNYTVIKCVIEEIDKANQEISFSELLQRINIKNSRFYRHFVISCTRLREKFCQYSTLEYTKHKLISHKVDRTRLRKLALSELSLHTDNTISWEVTNHKEPAKKKKRIVIGYSWIESLFGEALVMATKRGICGIAFSSEIGKNEVLSDMMQRWPQAKFKTDNEFSLKADLQVSISTSDPKIHVMGTEFQVQVWKALIQIPRGHVATYSDLAVAIGKPSATRAVSTAIGKNPISWFIPCHRVLRKSGDLGGYHWGLRIKRTMLNYESALRESKV